MKRILIIICLFLSLSIVSVTALDYTRLIPQPINLGSWNNIPIDVIAYWSFTSNDVPQTDQSSFQNNMTLTNGATWNGDGGFCDGVNDYFNASNIAAYNMTANGAYTILMWYTPMKSTYASTTIQVESTNSDICENRTIATKTYRYCNSTIESAGVMARYQIPNLNGDFGNLAFNANGHYNQSSSTAACNVTYVDAVTGTLIASANCLNSASYPTDYASTIENLAVPIRGNPINVTVTFRDIGIDVYLDFFTVHGGRDGIIEKQNAWGLWLSDGQLRPFLVNNSGQSSTHLSL